MDISTDEALIPPQVLAEIFVRIDCKRSVGCTCPLVCKRWYEILAAPGFWIHYMKSRFLPLPPKSLVTDPSLDLKMVAFKQPFGRNLLKNPSGEDDYEAWNITDNGGDRFKIEIPPVNCSECLDEQISAAFVTSYDWCKKYQIVDLWDEGITASKASSVEFLETFQPAFLDEFRPPITVSEYFNCRVDCAATYVMSVQLIPDIVFCSRTVPFEPSRNHQFGLPICMLYPELDGDTTSLISITRVRQMEQWTGAEWQRIEHTFENYPCGIRYVLFQHGGKDNQFWAGHYGAKMSKASVVVNYGDCRRRECTSRVASNEQSQEQALT